LLSLLLAVFTSTILHSGCKRVNNNPSIYT
jgi:hypothetical protein